MQGLGGGLHAGTGAKIGLDIMTDITYSLNMKSRKPKRETNRETNRVVVTLDPQHFEALDKIKKHTGATLAFTIRRALDRFLFDSKK